MRVPETPIVDANGVITQPFRSWANFVNRGTALVGTGSPEGVVQAPQYSEYIDSTGASGSIKYIKMQASIAGDRTQGWVLL